MKTERPSQMLHVPILLVCLLLAGLPMPGIADTDRTFEAILKIAEIDSGQPRRWFKAVDLTRVVSDVVEVYGAVAEAKNQSFSSEIGAVGDVVGDRDLLFRAIANIIDNAIKHTPEGGRIVVALGSVDGIPELTVADNGPGIPEEAHELVFRPLYRLDQSRGTPGRGLGLSIVAAVAALHRIELRLDDNKPGLKVTMRFPAEIGEHDSTVIAHRKRWFAFRRHYRPAQHDSAQTSEQAPKVSLFSRAEGKLPVLSPSWQRARPRRGK